MIATAQERMEFSELFDLDSDEEEGQKKTKYILFFMFTFCYIY